jgi:oligoribonuclease
MNDRVLFLDTETTGLSPQFCSILEVAAVVVDSDLQEHGSYQAVIWHSHQKVTSEMDGWCYDTHSRSGLLDEVERSPLILTQVDNTLAEFVRKHFNVLVRPVELAGNSVHFDLGFLKHHMPRTAALLSHQVQDVSGAARMVKRFFCVDVPKPEGIVTHRAMPDVRHSIEQLRIMRGLIRPTRTPKIMYEGLT